jgi:hypothetical protein
VTGDGDATDDCVATARDPRLLSGPQAQGMEAEVVVVVGVPHCDVT